MDSGFELLEEKVKKAASLVKALREENRILKEAVQAAHKEKGASAEEHKKTAALEQEVKRLRDERTQIKDRIARIVLALDAIE